MNRSKYAERIHEVIMRLEGSQCDTAWIIQPENRFYLSGYGAKDPQFTESSGSLLLSRSHSFLITDSRYIVEAEKDAVNFKIHKLEKGLAEELPLILSQIGTKNLGFEENYVTWGLHRELFERLDSHSPQVNLIPLNGIVEDMRETKDTQEIDAIRTSAELISGVLEEVVSNLKPGMTEKEVAWQVDTLAREKGAEELAFPAIVASGSNGALPHAVPTDKFLAEGEPIVMDVGARLAGYCSDITRTVFIGEPAEEFKIVYKVVRKAQLAALKEIRPGVKSTHPDGIARGLIGEAGYGPYFGHGLGHGVGLATHEGPRIGPRKPVELKKGMVVTVEPGIYLPGKGGVRLEQMVLIADEGPRILSGDRLFYEF